MSLALPAHDLPDDAMALGLLLRHPTLDAHDVGGFFKAEAPRWQEIRQHPGRHCETATVVALGLARVEQDTYELALLAIAEGIHDAPPHDPITGSLRNPRDRDRNVYRRDRCRDRLTRLFGSIVIDRDRCRDRPVIAVIACVIAFGVIPGRLARSPTGST